MLSLAPPSSPSSLQEDDELANSNINFINESNTLSAAAAAPALPTTTTTDGYPRTTPNSRRTLSLFTLETDDNR